jgi:hypothetical protein
MLVISFLNLKFILVTGGALWCTGHTVRKGCADDTAHPPKLIGQGIICGPPREVYYFGRVGGIIHTPLAYV